MDWGGRLSGRVQKMKPSALRELLKVTARPGMISFAGGMPAAELFPLERVEAGVKAVLKNLGGRALQYGETEGVPELRDWIARQCAKGKLQLTRENVLVTTGAQQALDLVGRVFLDEGDAVVVENPTYMSALLAWQPHGVHFLPMPIDERGIELDHAPELFVRRPKMAYFIPNFQNPTGLSLSLEQRKQLVELARQSGTPLVEDDPYSELRYEGEPVAALLELDQPPDDGGRVIHLGTFSKTLAPGFRIGWIVGPRVVIERLGRAKQAMDLHTSTFNQYLALELVNSGYREEMIPKFRQAYCERRNAMLDSMEKYFPAEARWTKPDGGMFIFATLAGEVSAADLLRRAIEQNVAFVPGNEFFVDGAGKNTMRLNFTRTAAAQITEGIRRLAGLMGS